MPSTPDVQSLPIERQSCSLTAGPVRPKGTEFGCRAGWLGLTSRAPVVQTPAQAVRQIGRGRGESKLCDADLVHCLAMGRSPPFGCVLAAIIGASACAEDEHGQPADEAASGHDSGGTTSSGGHAGSAAAGQTNGGAGGQSNGGISSATGGESNGGAGGQSNGGSGSATGGDTNGGSQSSDISICDSSYEPVPPVQTQDTTYDEWEQGSCYEDACFCDLAAEARLRRLLGCEPFGVGYYWELGSEYLRAVGIDSGRCVIEIASEVEGWVDVYRCTLALPLAPWSGLADDRTGDQVSGNLIQGIEEDCVTVGGCSLLSGDPDLACYASESNPALCPAGTLPCDS